MPNNLIALTGYSRCGKDTAADALVSIGYQRRCFGDIIKGMVEEAAHAGRGELAEFCIWLQSTGRGIGRVVDIIKGWSLVMDGDASPFTQEDSVKKLLRPLLEDYGLWKYDQVVERFFDSLPDKCVNSRLCRVAEGKMWRERGGLLVHIDRPGNGAHTEVEKRWMEELNEAGLIDVTIINDGDQEKLQQAIKSVATNGDKQ